MKTIKTTNKLNIQFIFLIITFIGYCSGACFSYDNPSIPSDQIPTPGERNLSYCTWYNSNTCCGSGILNLDATEPTFIGDCSIPVEDCMNYANLMTCSICSPEYSNYTDPFTGKFRVCKKFADKFYSKCSGALFYIDGSCQRVNSFSSAKDFIEQAFVNPMSYEKSNNDCFNVGNITNPIISLLLFSIILTFFLY